MLGWGEKKKGDSHAIMKESGAGCIWQTAEKTSLYSLLRLVHICPSDGSHPRVYYQTSDAKPIRFLTPKRAKKMNREVWTNWHYSHGPSEEKLSNVKVVPSVSSSSAFLAASDKAIQFSSPNSHSPNVRCICSKIWAGAHTHTHTLLKHLAALVPSSSSCTEFRWTI